MPDSIWDYLADHVTPEAAIALLLPVIILGSFWLLGLLWGEEGK